MVASSTFVLTLLLDRGYDLRMATYMYRWAVGLVAACMAPSAFGAISVVAPTASVPGSLTITSDLVFSINTAVPANSLVYFVMDDWVTYDGGYNRPALSPNLAFTINGISAPTSGSQIWDNYYQPYGDISAGDGILQVTNASALAVNDAVVLKAATYSLAAISGFNPQGTQTFTGNVFMINNAGMRISNIALIPEPSSAVALTVGGLLLASCRRRKTFSGHRVTS